MNLNSGDIVYCRIKGNTIVLPSEKIDAEIPFEIIGISPDGFLILYVPKYYNIRHSWQIEKDHIKDCNINKKYKGKSATAVPLHKVSRVIKNTPVQQDGMMCVKCGQFHYMAEANQNDGTLICYSCRTNPIKMLQPNKSF